MHGHKHVHGHYWNPTNSCKLKLNMWQTTHRVRQFFMQIYWRERWDTLPMCSFLWGTAMHGRTPVSGTPMCRCPPPPPPPPPLSKHKEQVETHAKHMVNNPGRGACSLPIFMHLKGGTNFQCVISHGGQPCMGRHVYMEPTCTTVRSIETQYTGDSLC